MEWSDLNRPVIFAVCISIASAVGFIFGAAFEDQANRKALVEQHQDVAKLFGWYESVVLDTLVLKDLDTIKSNEDLVALKNKWQRNGAAHVSLFRSHVTSMKKQSVKESALSELEAGVAEMEATYALRAP